MAVHFVGNTVSDFSTSVTPARNLDYTTGSGSNFPTELKNSFITYGGTSASANSYIYKDFSVQTGVTWIHFNSLWGYSSTALETNLASVISAFSENAEIQIWDSEGNRIFIANKDNINRVEYEYKVYLRDGSTDTGTVGSSLWGKLNGSPYSQHDIRIEPGVGIKYYINRQLVLDYSGNVGNSLSSTNGVGRIAFGETDEYTISYISGVIVCDFDTRYTRLHKITLNTTPSNNTSSSGSASDNVTVVHDYDPSEYETLTSPLLFDANAEQVVWPENDTHTLNTGESIHSVIVSSRALKSVSSPVSQLVGVVNISSTDYENASPTTIDTVTDSYQWVWETNPATAVAWTLSDLNSLGLGIRAKT